MAPQVASPNLTGLSPAQINELGKYRLESERLDVRRRAQDVATQVAIANAKFRRGDLDIKNKQLILDSAIQQMKDLETKSVIAKNDEAAKELRAQRKKMESELAGLKVMTTWQEDNPDAWPSAAMQANAGFKPVQEKSPTNNEKGVMSDGQAASYIEKQFLDTGMLSQLTGQEEKRAMVNSTMKLADSYKEGNRTQKTIRAAAEIRQRVLQYKQVLASGKYKPEDVKNAFYKHWGFIPED